MEAKRSIRSYIGLGPGIPLTAVLALIAAVICLVFALRDPSASSEPQESMLFDAREAGPVQDSADRPVYLDILGISEALYREGEQAYYVAERAEHEYCLVCLSMGQIDLLGAQREYWDGYSSVSLPFRLTGYRAEIPEAARRSICATFEMEDATFEANFGTMCFFDTRPPRSATPAGTALLVLSALAFLVFLLALCSLLLRLSAFANAIVRLEDAGALFDAAQELEADSTEIVNGDRLRLGEHFVFGWRNALAASWEDLVWCCEKPFPFAALELARMLQLGTADGKKHPVFFSAGAKKEIGLLIKRFAEKNPQLLQGADKATLAAFRSRCR